MKDTIETGEGPLTLEERRARLVDHLHSVESASIDELAELLLVSRMTIHRDLDRLEEQKVVRKSRNGATLLSSTVFEADYTYRSHLAVDEKTLIARAVAEQTERGMAVLVDDSSTAALVVPMVLDKRPLTIITNALSIVGTHCRTEGITLLTLGGTYDPICNAFFGIVAEQAIGRLRVDLALLSAAAVRGSRAYFHNPDVARFKLACLPAAERSILMVDHTKFHKSALHMFSPLDAFDEVISTDLLDAVIAEDLRKDRVRLTLVPTGENAATAADATGKQVGGDNNPVWLGGERGGGKEAHQRP